jgi:hypothetical protein
MNALATDPDHGTDSRDLRKDEIPEEDHLQMTAFVEKIRAKIAQKHQRVVREPINTRSESSTLIHATVPTARPTKMKPPTERKNRRALAELNHSEAITLPL